ncbi:transcriptional regulator [Marinomonas sp. SBI22]|uniref:nitric oxide reductase transcriptional regulator NorR n=1 Tax=unclassified Marinomonas TaxID=196814 RepID=UPI0007BC3E00|nr:MULTISPECIES: nitric oxide reductase transcriptional regulator NorR [unclassified Marinomonas]KZM40266.1 transcriptional regulator [Marinomonas sp. SBI22]KZM41683.1 transcriptional regulator [Marinomonas sp. SBI8L]
MITSGDLLELAIDMAQNVTTKDRFDRLLNTIRNIIPCDAVVLLKRQGQELKPLAQTGVNPELLGRRFEIASQPRFEAICDSQTPVRFASDCDLPDPYDGMLEGVVGDLPVHACMGFPLHADEQLIGILTLDSLTPGVFDDIAAKTLEVIAAVSAASLKTAILFKKLESHTEHFQNVVSELTKEALIKDGGELIGQSLPMQKMQQELGLVAPSDFAVLIEGETGVGKELVARTLHRKSTRAEGPLVYVNCAALPENLIESELFGHVKGAFTGADKDRAGKFSLANGGTLFLDEIGELPLLAQSKLLRALQSQEIQAVGKDQVELVDVRVIAATNRVLKEEVEANRFRSDLYHRLSVFPICIPPLRERLGDITLLAGYFTEQSRRKLGLAHLLIDDDVIARLEAYDWPGNVRELEHVMNRAALMARSDGQGQTGMTRIKTYHLGQLQSTSQAITKSIKAPEESFDNSNALVQQAWQVSNLKDATAAFQSQKIHQALLSSDYNWSKAARALDMDRANLVRLAKRLGIEVVKQVNR